MASANYGSAERVLVAVRMLPGAAPALANDSLGVRWPESNFTIGSGGLRSGWESNAEQRMDVADEFGALASGAIAGTGAAVAAGAVAVGVSDECMGTQYGEPSLHLTLHPTQLRVAGSQYLGCVVMNTTIALGALLLHWAIVFVLGTAAKHWKCAQLRISGARGRQVLDTNTAAAACRFPAISLCVELLMLPGGVAAGVHLIFSGRHVAERLAGAVVSLLHGVGVPLLLWRVMRDVTWRSTYRYDTEPQGRCNLRWLRFKLIGPGEWVNTVPGSLFRQRHGVMYNDAAPGRWWNVVMSTALNAAAAATRGFPRGSASACAWGALATAVLFAGYGVALFNLRPRNRPWDNGLALLEAGVMAVAMGLESVGFFRHDPVGSTPSWLAGKLLRILSATVLFRVFMDGTAEVTVWCSHRRWHLQEALWLERTDKSGRLQSQAADSRSSQLLMHVVAGEGRRGSTGTAQGFSVSVEEPSDHSLSSHAQPSPNTADEGGFGSPLLQHGRQSTGGSPRQRAGSKRGLASRRRGRSAVFPVSPGGQQGPVTPATAQGRGRKGSFAAECAAVVAAKRVHGAQDGGPHSPGAGRGVRRHSAAPAMSPRKKPRPKRLASLDGSLNREFTGDTGFTFMDQPKRAGTQETPALGAGRGCARELTATSQESECHSPSSAGSGASPRAALGRRGSRAGSLLQTVTLTPRVADLASPPVPLKSPASARQSSTASRGRGRRMTRTKSKSGGGDAAPAPAAEQES
eukprot:TRINITY_DN4802_c0_g1_i3.p1 TRINITY_DN4802_c0_g1~~TRINITY_DN4802_c0_g1_i3.p1  ORF type:complete len:746 (+),score=144.47 TRINITY_DN4802_c0_g1_i3:464-2701(+)